MKISISVRANSGRNEVEVTKNGTLVVHTKETPKENKANKSVVKVLAKHFHTAPSCISIIKGARSKKKVVEIIK